MQNHARVVIFGGGMMRMGVTHHLVEAGWKGFCLIQTGKRCRLSEHAEWLGIH